MKNDRLTQFAIAGFLAAFALLGLGFSLDRSGANIRASYEVFFNWLSLLFAPISLFPRLTNPDSPIVTSWSNCLLVLAANAAYYAAGGRLLQVFLGRLSERVQAYQPHRQEPANSASSRLGAPLLDLDKV